MDFDMIGRLSISRETDKFKPYTENTYDSGWTRKQLMFNVLAGDNRHMLTSVGGAFADGHGDVYTFTKSYVDESGTQHKGESLRIPFKDRLTSPKLPEVAEFRKFIFDTEVRGRRTLLEQYLQRLHEGDGITDEELAKVGVDSINQLESELEKSKKKHKEFISEWDFVDHIKKVIESGKYADKKFYVRGSVVFSYSEKNDRVYETYQPKRIYLAADDAEEYSTANLQLVYNKDSLDTMSADEGKYFVNGWVMDRDNNNSERKVLPVPTTIVFYDAPETATPQEKKIIEGLKKKFTVDDDTYKVLGIDVDMINGSQKTEITPDMLTDEQREDLEYGLITMAELRRDLGVVYGPTIREYRYKNIGRGFATGRKDTVYTDDDMLITIITDEAELEDGLFDNDEDDDI